MKESICESPLKAVNYFRKKPPLYEKANSK